MLSACAIPLIAKSVSNSGIAQATVLNTANGQNLLRINGIVQTAAVEHDIYIMMPLTLCESEIETEIHIFFLVVLFHRNLEKRYYTIKTS